jgi:UDP:flavonoid glycosyltransferase YjiC (YdhE family)
VRVLATVNRRAPAADGSAASAATEPLKPARAQLRPLPAADNATVVEWLSYSRTIPHCDVVVCHVGHGTLVRTLACGCPLVACPVAGDMAENAARVDWAGAGVRVPRRFIKPRPLRLAVERVLEDRSIPLRAQSLARWAAQHDAGATAAGLIEQMIERSSPRRRARPVTDATTAGR